VVVTFGDYSHNCSKMHKKTSPSKTPSKTSSSPSTSTSTGTKKKTIKETSEKDNDTDSTSVTNKDNKENNDHKSDSATGTKTSSKESSTVELPASPMKDAGTDPLEGEDPGGQLIKSDELKDLLECPVCLRVPRGSPIYQCARGHVVCGVCRPNVTTCPQCRDVLGNIRSLVSEKMLEKLPTTCKFNDHGCQVELMRNQLSEHERTCSYREVNCVDLACQQKVAMSRLLTHLENDHETEDFVRVEGDTYRSHFIVNEDDFTKDIMWISDQLHYDGSYFYRECCRSNEGLWYIWVYLLGVDSSHSKNSQYTCTISIHSGDGEEELSYRSRPLSLDHTKEDIARSGRGLVFTDTTARLFWKSNKVRYSVSIQKLATQSSQGERRNSEDST